MSPPLADDRGDGPPDRGHEPPVAHPGVLRKNRRGPRRRLGMAHRRGEQVLGGKSVHRLKKTKEKKTKKRTLPENCFPRRREMGGESFIFFFGEKINFFFVFFEIFINIVFSSLCAHFFKVEK